MPRPPRVSPQTLAAQSLGEIDPSTRALITPLHPSTTFERDADLGYPGGRGYSRSDSPAYDAPERLLAALEGGASAMLFASGMAAATAPFCALVPGDHVVVPRVLYWGLRKWLADFAVAWGITVTLVDTSSVDAVAAAMRPGRTRLVWAETPANPTWEVADLAALAEVAHRNHARLVVDSTVATPVFTRPLELGADLVMHSATKYLNGHSDVIAGALVTAVDDPFWQRLRAWRHDQGAVLGPFEAWLLLRGMRTLHVRVRQQAATAQLLAEHLAGHPAVAEVLYPGLPGSPGHEVARRQMTGGFGAMLSVRIRGGRDAAVAVAAATRVFVRATSLGGTESLVEHRASIEGPASPVPDDLLRLSIGLEDPDDLLADLDAALAAAPVGPAVTTAVTTAVPAPVRDVPEGDRALVVARGGDLAGAGPVGSPGAWLPFVRPLPLPGGDASPGGVGDAVAAVLASVAPSIAAHDGAVEVDGLEDGSHGAVVRVRLTGRCQGCALAEITVHQGLGPMLRAVPGVAGVVDVTDHAAGTDPYRPPAAR
jgi:cystathionine gamma-synthase